MYREWDSLGWNPYLLNIHMNFVFKKQKKNFCIGHSRACPHVPICAIPFRQWRGARANLTANKRRIVYIGPHTAKLVNEEMEGGRVVRERNRTNLKDLLGQFCCSPPPQHCRMGWKFSARFYHYVSPLGKFCLQKNMDWRSPGKQ